MKEALDLLSCLVACPSPSGKEAAISELTAGVVEELGLKCEHVGESVLAYAQRCDPKILYVSHLDTVPVGAGWSVDPFAARWIGDQLVGRGACDAKASAAAMLWSLSEAAKEGAADGVVVALTTCEETTNTGMGDVLGRLGMPELAVVGEPTGLEVVRAQGGLAIIEAEWRGKSCHAAHAYHTSHTNALVEASKELGSFGFVHELPSEVGLLGPTTIVPTVMNAGERHNVVPDAATAIFDCRLSPPHDAATCLDRIALSLPGASLRIRSDRLKAIETGADHRLVQVALGIAGKDSAIGSNTLSDMALLQGVPAIKCGPGDSLRSHKPDEFVTEEEFLAGCHFYRDLLFALVREAVAFA
ncbi:MAG: hypothetical protein CMJ89_10545 [Planctomycetes bacterium]|jgi:acetylornithine deacetylase|nr:hypothetical protein [Planctomycetota bacterium]